MAKILSGKILRDKYALRLMEQISTFKKAPTLAIIQVGNLPESTAYINQKNIFGLKIGATVKHIVFPVNVSEGELIKKIRILNKDKGVHGIIIQLPISKGLNVNNIIESIDPIKDVDGLHSLNMKMICAGNEKDAFVPATAKGIINLLEEYKIPISGKKFLVIGRSMLVGKPTALVLLNRNATVTVAHHMTKPNDLKKMAKEADGVVVAVGRPLFFGPSYFRKGQTVIDVGINLINPTTLQLRGAGKGLKEEISSKKKLVGDVDFDKVSKIVKAITPVPGGVGAMTVAALFENLISAYQRQM